MQAVILAAGMGSRLKELTKNNTKCMVKVNGVSLIERMLRQLMRQPIEKIVIVVGYERQKLIDYIQSLQLSIPIEYIENPIYDKTNNIYSLALAKEELLKDDTILLESDLIFEDAMLTNLIEDERASLMLVDKYERWMDGTCVKLGEGDTITDFIPGKQFDFTQTGDYYKTVNIYKFGREFSAERYVPALENYMEENGLNDYYEQVLRVILQMENPMILAKRLSGETWYEIDDEQDLDIAESLFEENDERKTERIAGRGGGYWRYPKLLNFSGAGEFNFPTPKLLAELKANLGDVVTQYPSNQKVQSLLAAKNFGVKQEHIIVGNGAAELIKAVMEKLDGKTGFIRPTFEEYLNRYEQENVIFKPQDETFRYTADELISFFSENRVNNLVIVNPDNPTGNYLNKTEMKKLLEWTKQQEITLLWDESFVDFAEEEENSLIQETYLSEYPNLIVVKSISESYGVPGLRLGVLASGDEELIAWMKKDVAIWNINSLAEYYMQIEEKYKKDYVVALQELRKERADFVTQLCKIPGIKVLPSQANYLMVELTNGKMARSLTKELLICHNILIKDLTKKVGDSGKQYVRIAVRNHEENARLVETLRRCI